VAVVMCMTDSLDEPRTRRAAASKSPVVIRSSRLLSHYDRRCQSARVNIGACSNELSTDFGRRKSFPASSTWQYRRPGDDYYRNGRPTPRCPVVQRAQDAAVEVRQPATAARRSDDDVSVALAAGFSPTLVSDVREVRRLMNALNSHVAAKDAIELVARDWRLVATCIDRTLFCFYCTVVAVSLAAFFPSPA